MWKVWSWVKDYFGTFQLDPNEELKEIPNHSSFFILSPDNRCAREGGREGAEAGAGRQGGRGEHSISVKYAMHT